MTGIDTPMALKEACDYLAEYHKRHPAEMNVFKGKESRVWVLTTSDPEVVAKIRKLLEGGR